MSDYFCPCGNWLTMDGPADTPTLAWCTECDKWVVPEKDSPDAEDAGDQR